LNISHYFNSLFLQIQFFLFGIFLTAHLINSFIFAFKTTPMSTRLRFLFAFIFVSSPAFFQAQITITQSEMPTIGTKVVMGLDTSGAFSPQAASSSSQTWNYSALASPEFYSYLFVNPMVTPFYPYFHTSNLADSMVYGNGYSYYSSMPTYFSQIGFGEILFDSVLAISVHPYFEQIPLPATYGTADGGSCYGDTTRSFVYLLYDSARGVQRITYWDTVDAYGVMTTPYGTDSVIRQRHYDLTIDSIFVRSTISGWGLYKATTTPNYQYRWYAKGINYYFAVMQMNSKGTTDSTVLWYDGTDVGIDKITHSAFTNVYPNPCHTQVTFACSSPQARQIDLFDITGRQLSSQEIKNGKLILNTAAYSIGMYFYRVSDISGNILDRGKFIVQ
jgi:hypothetical protein